MSSLNERQSPSTNRWAGRCAAGPRLVLRVTYGHGLSGNGGAIDRALAQEVVGERKRAIASMTGRTPAQCTDRDVRVKPVDGGRTTQPKRIRSPVEIPPSIPPRLTRSGSPPSRTRHQSHALNRTQTP